MKRLAALLCLCCLLLAGCDSTSESDRAYNEGFIDGYESGFKEGREDYAWDTRNDVKNSYNEGVEAGFMAACELYDLDPGEYGFAEYLK